MLILILVNVHYLQNIVFSFEGSMIKITPCQIRTTQDSPPSRSGEGGFPLKNTGDGSIYIPPKLQNLMLMVIL